MKDTGWYEPIICLQQFKLLLSIFQANKTCIVQLPPTLQSSSLLEKFISFFTWKILFEWKLPPTPMTLELSQCSTLQCLEINHWRSKDKTSQSTQKSFNSSCSKFLEINRKNYKWAQNKLNCNHAVMTNFSIMLHQEWLDRNVQCWKKGTNEAASFPKPCRTVCKKDLPQTREHGGVMS